MFSCHLGLFYPASISRTSGKISITSRVTPAYLLSAGRDERWGGCGIVCFEPIFYPLHSSRDFLYLHTGKWPTLISSSPGYRLGEKSVSNTSRVIQRGVRIDEPDDYISHPSDLKHLALCSRATRTNNLLGLSASLLFVWAAANPPWGIVQYASTQNQQSWESEHQD